MYENIERTTNTFKGLKYDDKIHVLVRLDFYSNEQIITDNKN